jgi:rhodanese-related sulfurtransferase
MKPHALIRLAAAQLVLSLATAAHAGDVVADSACPYYADDIAAFATCEGDKVVHSEPAAASTNPTAVSEVSAERAREMLLEARGRAIFVDVRTWSEVAFVGRPEGLDAVVPYLEVDAITGEPGRPTVRMRAGTGFVERIAAQLEARVLEADATIVLICRSGERSRDAARELMRAGYRNVHSVKHGFEGPLAQRGSEQGQRRVAGWRHAGLPWQQRTASGAAQ